MGENVIILEITSGICCILTAVFLHFSAIPGNSNKRNYQKGYTLVKVASLVLGISALLFAIAGEFMPACDKQAFIQIILPVETLLVFWVFVYPLYERERLKHFLKHQAFYTAVLCAANIGRRMVPLPAGSMLCGSVHFLHHYIYTYFADLAE